MTPEQKELLSAKLPAEAVRQRSQSGSQVSYVEGHYVIRKANEIFGFNGWTRETLEMNLVQTDQEETGNKRYTVAYTAKVRIHALGVTREGFGFGNGLNKDLGAAHELAVKEAETDAMKRALMTFGDVFGLALYDKKQENVEKQPAPPKKETPPESKPKPEWVELVKTWGMTQGQLAEWKNAVSGLGFTEPGAMLVKAKESGAFGLEDAFAWLETQGKAQ